MDTLRILSGGAAQGLVARVAEVFARDTGCAIDGTFSAVGAMQDRLLAGEACDLVILTRAIVGRLIESGHVAKGSALDLGTVATGVAVRLDDPAPRIDAGDALRVALLGATSLHHPDAALATAGIHFLNVVERLGIGSAVAGRLRPSPNGATAMRELARAADARPIGVTQVTEILSTPGVRLVGALPPGFELATVYTAGVCVRAARPDAARALLPLLAQAATGEVGRQLGFGPLT